MNDMILKTQSLKRYFPVKRGLLGRKLWLRAVDGVDLEIKRGETVGLVGESGCGKSTLGRLILRLLDPTDGKIIFEGADITDWSQRKLRSIRKRMQIVFQDPYSSLNPRIRVGDAVREVFDIHRIGGSKEERKERVRELFQLVGLDPGYYNRYPHEFSGGQRQRICIARAVASEPALVVADEPVSALDVSVQAQILNLFMELRDRLGLSYLFISHDLSVIRHICDRVIVMYLGKVVEEGETERVLTAPSHPYTRALIDAIPKFDEDTGRKKILLSGDVPSPIHLPTGCRFHPRCPSAREDCRVKEPTLEPQPSGSQAACFYPCSG